MTGSAQAPALPWTHPGASHAAQAVHSYRTQTVRALQKQAYDRYNAEGFCCTAQANWFCTEF